MKYLRTRQGTQPALTAGRESVLASLIAKVAEAILPASNPDYRDSLDSVKEWLIEFDEQGRPWRERGLDAHGHPIVAGPDARNHGFWLDTNMTLAEFQGEEITRQDFETLWLRSGVREA